MQETEFQPRETIEDPAAYWPAEIEGIDPHLTTCIRCRRMIPHPDTKAVSTRTVAPGGMRSWKGVGRICNFCLLVIEAGGRIE